MSGAQQFRGSAPGGASFQHDGPENPTVMGGSNNPSLGGDQKRGDGPAQEVAGTLPNDFSLRGNMTQEYKGEDKTEARVLPAEVDGNNPLSTAGPPGDKAHRKDFQSHEVDASLPTSDSRSIQGHGNRQDVF